MSRGTASALTIVRVPHGALRPQETAVRAALARDRARLNLPPAQYICDYAIAGPYQVVVDGRELDEYVVWER